MEGRLTGAVIARRKIGGSWKWFVGKFSRALLVLTMLGRELVVEDDIGRRSTKLLPDWDWGRGRDEKLLKLLEPGTGLGSRLVEGVIAY